MKHVLITGGHGFVGSRLANELSRRDPSLSLTLADRSTPSSTPDPRFKTIKLDVTDAASVQDAIRAAKPTHIVHLAAQANVPASFADPHATWETNTIGTLNLVQAILQHAPAAYLLFVSSAEVYGSSAFDGQPVTEQAALNPVNPYAASKAAADILVREAANRGLSATVVRPFNHTGPGQQPMFVLPAFSEQIAKIEHGQQEPVMHVGELDDVRDFMDVDDVVDLYARLVEAGPTVEGGTVLNAASGTGTRIQNMLDRLLAASTVDIEVRRDPKRLRAKRVPVIIGNADRAAELIGWRADTPFNDTIDRTLAYWRAKVSGQ